ncbi:hypothetical protein [Henriciella aquimarina]|uniref:hypothetical protein n=1 Tax=Henriciella aquimarina TaxID=545261 RepID=UPI000A02289C|nr:hypothetical protein [Henriciella aquimarina]
MTHSRKERPGASVFKAVCVAGLGLGLAATASAKTDRDSFEVAFNYAPNAPVEQIYTDFVHTAQRACRIDPRVTPVPTHLRAQRACETDLLGKAVAKTGLEDLIAHHTDLTATTPRTTRTSSK